MKRLLLIFLIFLSLCSCDKDDNSMAPLDKLPPQTSIGANTAGCLINGEAFLPKGNFAGRLFCQYINDKDFSVAIGEKVGDRIRNINVASLNEKLEVNKIYKLSQYAENSKYGEFIIFNPDFSRSHYSTNSTITGELKITNLNLERSVISGTFWFDAVDNTGEKIEVREGRFDMEY